MKIIPIYGYGYDSNIYLITGSKTTIIDTGTGMHSKKIINKINKITPLKNIEQIILTHEHYDHTGGAIELQRQSNMKTRIIAHTLTASALKKGEGVYAELFGAETTLINVDAVIKNNEDIQIGDEVFTTLHTPGHSPGSVCLYSEHSKTLISGDTVFSDGGFGRFDLPGGNAYNLIESIKKLTTLEVEDLYPGHGPIVTGEGDKHIKEAWLNIKSMMPDA